MKFLEHFKLVWKDFVVELKRFEYGQYFFAYLLVVIFLFSSNKSKDLSIVGMLEQNYFSLLLFLLIVTIILVFTIPNNVKKTKQDRWMELKYVSFGFIEKFGSIVFTGYGILSWYLLFIIYNKQMWNGIMFFFGILFFMFVIKFFLSAIKINKCYSQCKE